MMTNALQPTKLITSAPQFPYSETPAMLLNAIARLGYRFYVHTTTNRILFTTPEFLHPKLLTPRDKALLRWLLRDMGFRHIGWVNDAICHLALDNRITTDCDTPAQAPSNRYGRYRNRRYRAERSLHNTGKEIAHGRRVQR